MADNLDAFLDGDAELDAFLDAPEENERGLLNKLLDAPAYGLGVAGTTAAKGLSVAEGALRGLDPKETVTGKFAREQSPEVLGIPEPTSIPGKVFSALGSSTLYLNPAGLPLAVASGVGDQQARIEKLEEATGVKVGADEKAAAYGLGGTVGTAEAVLGKYLGGKIPFLNKLESGGRLQRGTGGALVEGGTELTGNVGQDLTEQVYNDEASVNWGGAAGEGGIGAAVGGILGAALPGRAPAVDPNAPEPPGTPSVDDLTREPEKPTDSSKYAEEKLRLDGEITELQAKIDAAKETQSSNSKSRVVKAWKDAKKAAEDKLSEIHDLEYADQFPDDPHAQSIKAQIMAERQAAAETPTALPNGGPSAAGGAPTVDVTGATRTEGPLTGKANQTVVDFNNAQAREQYEAEQARQQRAQATGEEVSTEGIETGEVVAPPTSSAGARRQTDISRSPELVQSQSPTAVGQALEQTTNKAAATAAPSPEVSAEKELAGVVDISDEYEALSKEAKADREYRSATQILDGITGDGRQPKVKILEPSQPVEIEPYNGEQITMEGDSVERDTGIDVGEIDPNTVTGELDVELSGEMTPTELELGKVEPVNGPLDPTRKVNPFAKKEVEEESDNEEVTEDTPYWKGRRKYGNRFDPDEMFPALRAARKAYGEKWSQLQRTLGLERADRFIDAVYNRITESLGIEQGSPGSADKTNARSDIARFNAINSEIDAALARSRSPDTVEGRAAMQEQEKTWQQLAERVQKAEKEEFSLGLKTLQAAVDAGRMPPDEALAVMKKANEQMREGNYDDALDTVVDAAEKAEKVNAELSKDAANDKTNPFQPQPLKQDEGKVSNADVAQYKAKINKGEPAYTEQRESDLADNIESGNLDGALSVLSSSTSPITKRVALLARAFRTNSRLQVLTTKLKAHLDAKFNSKNSEYSKAGGVHDEGTGISYVDTNGIAKLEHVVAHEVSHGLTAALLDPDTRDTHLTPKQQKARAGIHELWDYINTNKDTLGVSKEYGLTNVSEFVSEAFSNPRFQAALSKIKYKNSNMWSRFCKHVADLLGIENDNALTEFLTLQEHLTEDVVKAEIQYKERKNQRSARGEQGKLTPADKRDMSVDAEYQRALTALDALQVTGAITPIAKQIKLKALRALRDDGDAAGVAEVAAQWRKDAAKAEAQPLLTAMGFSANAAASPLLEETQQKVADAAGFMARSYRSFADVLEASPNETLQKLGRGVRDYVDNRGKYEGQVRTRMKPGLEALRNLRATDKKKFDEQMVHLSDFFRHRDWGRPAEAKAAAEKMSPEARLAAKSIMDSYNYVGNEASRIGIKMLSGRKVVPFRMRANYAPRIVSHEYANAMNDPYTKDPDAKAKVDKVVKWMLENSKAKTADEAKAAMADYSAGVRRLDDFHGNLERSRSNSMPEFIYDYSVDAAKQYLNLSTERLAQVSALGQSIGPEKTLFDQAVKAPIDKDTKDMIITGAGQIYGHNIETMQSIKNNPWLNAFNSFVTGSALGSPIASWTNLIGGVGNIMMVLGSRKGIYSIAKDIKDFKNLRDLGDAIGLTPDDVMNMHDTFSVIESGKGTGRWLAKKSQQYADFMLNINMFKKAEQWNRVMTLIVARAELQDAFLRDKNGSRKASQRLFLDRLEREGIDWEKLKAEGGEVNGNPDSETAKYYRKLSNLMQGSYQIDQTPLYVNSPWGRAFFKFWKFNTQQTRLLEREFWIPLVEASIGYKKGTHTLGDVTLRATKLLAGFAKAGLTGVGISMGRLALNPKTELSKIITAANQGDIVGALGEAFWTVIAGMFAEGTLGLVSMLGETAEWAVDNFVEDDIVTKKFGLPMMPASAGVLENTGALLNNLHAAETGEDYKRALGTFTKDTSRFIRDGKKITDWIEASVVPESNDGKVALAQINRLHAQKYLQDYLEVNGINTKLGDDRNFLQKVFGLEPSYTKKNRELKDAVREKIEQGDPAAAKQLMDEALAKIEDRKERRYLKDSIKKSLRWYYPLRVDMPATEEATAEEESLRVRDEFIAYMADKYPKETVTRLTEAADLYENTVREAGLWETR